MLLIEQNVFIAQTINLILLIAIMYYFLQKPVRKIIDERTAEIEGQIKSAEENQRVAEELRAELEKQLSESKQQARAILDDAAKKAEAVQNEIIKEAQREAQAIIANAKEAAQREREKAWTELKAEVGDLSLLLASRVIGETLESKKHQHLIDQTLSQLESLKSEQIQ